MEKEILPMELIQHEIRQSVRHYVIGGTKCFFFSIILLWLMVKAIIWTDFYYRSFLLLGFPICFFVISVMLFCRAFTLHSLVENPEKLVVVKDRLVNMEIKGNSIHKKPHRHGVSWHLYFENHGKYELGNAEYLLSDQYWQYKAEDVYCSSAIGDEFYLILSKPRKGAILYIYNTKLFTLQPLQR